MGFFDKACIVGILPRFLECLVCSATPKTKTTLGILQLWFNYFTTYFFNALGNVNVNLKIPKKRRGPQKEHTARGPRVWGPTLECWYPWDRGLLWIWWSGQTYARRSALKLCIKAEPEEGPPATPAGGRGGQKGGPQIWSSTFVTAYRDTRTELTKN